VNWPSIIAEIEAAGWTVYKISVRLNVQYIQVQRAKEGGRVSYELGDGLLKLRDELGSTGNITNVPRTQAFVMRTA
jgi:hypothetical protein